MPSKPYNVPQWFAESLHDFDEKLRIRWGHQEGNWRIERKVTRGKAWAESMGDDDREMRAAGYVLCLRFLPNQMDRRVFYTLFVGDMWRVRKYIDQMERREVDEIMAKRRRYSEENEYAAKEWWTTMNTLHPKSKGGQRGRSDIHWGA